MYIEPVSLYCTSESMYTYYNTTKYHRGGHDLIVYEYELKALGEGAVCR